MGHTVHWILQARILEQVAFPFSSRSSWSRNQTGVSCIAGSSFTRWAKRESPRVYQRFHLHRVNKLVTLVYDAGGQTFSKEAETRKVWSCSGNGNVKINNGKPHEDGVRRPEGGALRPYHSPSAARRTANYGPQLKNYQKESSITDANRKRWTLHLWQKIN